MLNSKRWKNRCNHLPSIQVVLSTCTILSGTQNCGKFLPQKSTAFWCHAFQPICGLHLIKPDLCMAAESAAPMFLKMVQGTVLMGLCVWSSIIVKNPILFFSCPYKFSHFTTRTHHRDIQVLNTSNSYCLFLVKLSDVRQKVKEHTCIST